MLIALALETAEKRASTPSPINVLNGNLEKALATWGKVASEVIPGSESTTDEIPQHCFSCLEWLQRQGGGLGYMVH